ncbi:MAG: (d)CMP kinase [Bryobacteraceae bacterium]
MSKPIVVAIDGPAGSGKSTIARRIANRLDFVYVDTGAMYRAVALWALRTGVDVSDMHRLEQLARSADIRFEAGSPRVFLNGEEVTDEIRTPEVADAASQVAAVPAVRRALVEKQHRIGETASIVMEGRDIGSVVFPEAKVKIFLDADPAVRAERRHKEMPNGNGIAEVAAQIAERDLRDRTRTEAPLVQAPDAVYIDTSRMTLDEVEELILKVVRDRTSNGKEVAR